MLDKFNISRVRQNFERLKTTLPTLLANETRNFFVDSFKRQGWEDKSLNKWEKRKSDNKKNEGRAILVKSGALKRAVANSIRSKTFEKIELIVPLKYAAVHNDGYDGPVSAHARATFFKTKTTSYTGLKQSKKTGKFYMAKSTKTLHIRGEDKSIGAHNRSIPQRKFMGDSVVLRSKQSGVIKKQIEKVWQA